jgi:hypothetical protein
MENCEIKGLFWKQPYANLMLHGKIETRTWKTNYRGLVLICSSKISYSNKIIKNTSTEKQFEQIQDMLKNEDIKLGYAVAVGKLADCRLMQLEDEDKCFVKYNPNLYCHVYENIKPIEPFLIKGKMGWLKLNDEILKKIKII